MNFALKIFVILILVLAFATPAHAQLSLKNIVEIGCDTISGCARLLIEWAIKSLAFPLAVIFILLAGFQFVTAQGSEQKIQQAKQTLVWTIIGLAITVGAWALSVAFQLFFQDL